MASAFYIAEGARFIPTPLTRGPWDRAAQHGGPPAALVSGALARWGADATAFFLARVTVSLLRPVPLAPLSIDVHPVHLGRRVQRLRGVLSHAGRPVLQVDGVRIRRAVAPRAVPGGMRDWPDPACCPRFRFPFFEDPVGYHQAVELGLAYGTWGKTPVGFWARPAVPLVQGRSDLPVESLLVLADAQSGMGPPLDPSRYAFVNPDLTVYLERDPGSGWLGFDVRSVSNGQGSGLSQSEIRDGHGVMGRSVQSLVVWER